MEDADLEKLAEEYYLNNKEVLVKESINSTEFRNDFETLINLGLTEKKDTKHIIISPLQSSFLIGSYECMIAFYNDEIYLDLYSNLYYIKLYRLKELIKGLEEEILENEKTDGDEITDYQKACICYETSLKFYEDIGDIFRILVSRLRENEEFKLKLESIKISYGRYMEKSKLMGEPV